MPVFHRARECTERARQPAACAQACTTRGMLTTVPSACCERPQILDQARELVGRGESLRRDGICDRLEGDGREQLHLALDTRRMHDMHPDVGEAAGTQQFRESWTDVRIGAARVHDRRVELDEPRKRVPTADDRTVPTRRCLRR